MIKIFKDIVEDGENIFIDWEFYQNIETGKKSNRKAKIENFSSRNKVSWHNKKLEQQETGLENC